MTFFTIPPQAILIVTHGIEEAVIMADRIIVLGRNPGRIRADLPVTLPHYRDRKHPSFQALVDKVYTIITNPELEKIESTATNSVQPATPPAKYQSLPAVRIGSIAGLLELLEDRQEKDLYRLAQELQLEVDEILPIVGIGYCQASPTLRTISDRIFQPLQTALDDSLIRSFPMHSVPVNAKGNLNLPSFLNWVFVSGFTLIVLWGTWETVLLLRTLGWADWQGSSL